MTRSHTFTVFLIIMTFVWSAESALKQVTSYLGKIMETPQWSASEQALYMVDIDGQKLFRYDERTCNVTSKRTACGPTGLIIPLANAPPGYIMFAIRTVMYVLDFNSPNIDDYKRFLFSVDEGKPDNLIHDAKCDGNGRLWFGTFGAACDTLIPGLGTLYMVTNETYTCPRVEIRPVGQSDGITWSPDYKKMYYNDRPTRKIAVYDYNLKTGEIANKTIFFDFKQKRIAGSPNGMTVDRDGNIWVATDTGHEVLKINHVNAEVMLKFNVPVNSVTSVIFGGVNYTTLYITTSVNPPPCNSKPRSRTEPGSGALFAYTDGKSQGLPPKYMEIRDVQNY